MFSFEGGGDGGVVAIIRLFVRSALSKSTTVATATCYWLDEVDRAVYVHCTQTCLLMQKYEHELCKNDLFFYEKAWI